MSVMFTIAAVSMLSARVWLGRPGGNTAIDGQYGGGGVAEGGDGDRVTSRRRGWRGGLEAEGRQGVVPASGLMTRLCSGEPGWVCRK